VRFGKLRRVLVTASTAAQFTIALLITFLGIGVIANVLIVYALVQVFGERRQNEEHRNGNGGQ
jgi:predicted membrane protein